MYLRNDSNHSIHISLKNSLEKITKIKKKHYYLINKDFYNLAVLKLSLKYQQDEHPHLETSTNKDVFILFNIKTYQDAEPYKFKEIMNKYLNI